MERIFIAEDDERIYGELKLLLELSGYCVVTEEQCDLALLDINLPGENGFELCKRIKKTGVPVIMLTARDSADDELLGFTLGADDYVKKPYNSSVLLARIARLLKKEDKLNVRGLRLNAEDFSAEYKENGVPLSRNEAKILRFLMQKPVCTKDEMVEYLWQNGSYIDENALYVTVNRLREKLKSIGADEFLYTVKGVGYRL